MSNHRIITPALIIFTLTSAGSVAYGMDWEVLPGLAMDIGVGANGAAWAIGSPQEASEFGYPILRWNGIDNWDRVKGAAVRIAVSPEGTPWVVNSKNTIFRWKNGD